MNGISKILIAFTSLCLSSIVGFAQKSQNLSFELKNYNTSLPKYWIVGGKGFSYLLDSVENHAGKYSLKMEKTGDLNGDFGVYTGTLPIETYAGKSVEYRGWVKTKGVKNGYAGLWLRVDGENGATLGFDNMEDRGLKGDNNWTQVSIKMDVNKDAKNIIFGGLFPGEGTVWFDDLELYINGEKFVDIVEAAPKTSLSPSELAALKKYSYPLRTYEPDSGDTKDLKPLDKLIGSSKVVALGEVTHGSSEIFKMKNRIIQYLAVNKGFDLFSMEANMPESYKLNDYTVRGEGDPKKLIAGMYFWTWQTDEVLNMVEWMRRFNQPKQRITFTGFDMQFYAGAVNEILNAFKENKEIKDKIDSLKNQLDVVRSNAQKNSGMIVVDASAKKEINDMISFLKNSVEISSFKTAEKAWLQQNIVIIEQYLAMNNYSWRDECMADNFMWIKEQNPQSKFVIWAHNAHIMETNQMQGDRLAQKLKDDYVTFGFSFYDGSYTAVGKKGLTSYDAVKAYPGTLEYLLEQVQEPMFILDLKKAKSDKHKDIEWLLGKLEYRRTGAGGGNPIEFSEGKISEDFDYLIFIKTSSPSTLLPANR
ncbi:erythromycin esterase family protein [Sphingobacterium detergens]|uniref:Erythromycin esterase n=1 Tax=Sphingobacterium detergens TaxID=1145106 RepID=A0A420B6F7_SPHD1|nr:erythromycin esterase family protein [Sphingobacterium detergens]RKE52297.1 erythromycin esterase [Sphingobacterium detergens]